MTVQSVRSPGATTINVNTVSGVPTNFMATMGEPHTFVDPVTGEEITIISEETAVDFSGHIDAGQLEIDEIAAGYSDTRGSEVGDIVVIRPTTQWADLIAQFLTPTGMVSPFAGSIAPDEWLLCDGASVERDTYPRLFDVIGTTYGSVDGDHFTLPDLRDRSPVGAGQSTYIDTQAAANYNVSDTITVNENDTLHTGQAVVLTTSGTAPGGLTAGNTYYVIRLTSTTIKLAASRADAVAGTAINITSTGTGSHTLTLTFTNRTLGAKGGEEAHANTLTETASHRHEKAAQFGTDGNSFSDYGAWSRVGGSASGGAGYTNYQGGSEAHNNMQPYLALNYIIKT